MKKSLMALLILLFCINFNGFGQDTKVQQQVQTIRKTAYTRVLNLTDVEAQQFWPVFDEMQAKINEVKHKAKDERVNIAKNNLSDAQMEHAIDNLLTYEQQGLDIKKKYYQKFKKILPIRKVALLPRAEAEFKRDLLRIIKNKVDSEE